MDSDHEIYLSDVSPKDKPWDTHRHECDQVRALYARAGMPDLAEKLKKCSLLLGFKGATDAETGEIGIKLDTAWFCRVRHCPVCQWRKSLMWTARMFEALPSILMAYPTARFIFLTLTVDNVPVEGLRVTISDMNTGWRRLIKRKQFPAIGFFKSVEVTRGKDGKAHPHFHVLMMVPSGYFKSGNYLTQADWTEMWKDSARLSYTPIVNVKAVKPKAKKTDAGTPITEIGPIDPILEKMGAMEGAIRETVKYSVKGSDLAGHGPEWLAQLTIQLHKTRSIALGGVFKKYMSEDEPDDLIGESEEKIENGWEFLAGWREKAARYQKIDT
jgi:plasmid rolling circle replication initiator protein Rep